MEVIKVMLIEDHNVFREGLKKLIDMEENMRVVAEAGTYQQALDTINPTVDVILLDINLPDGDGLELCSIFKIKYPHIKHVALTTYDDAVFIKKAMDFGVNGFVPKYAFFDEIKAAITMTHRGSSYIHPGLTDTLLGLSKPSLSDSELKILQLLSQGKNQREVAELMFISLSTLRRRIRSVLSKLEVSTVEEALTTAIKKGLIH